MALKLTHDEMLRVDVGVLRMHLRERAHHLLELPLYKALYGHQKPGESVGKAVSDILEVWHTRGLPADLPDVIWVQKLLQLLQQVRDGADVDPADMPDLVMPRALSESELAVVDSLVRGRRSYRQWTQSPVPSELVRRVLEAGTWAPSTCNYQSLRFLVLTRPDEIARFRNMEFGLEQVKIVACADCRPWESDFYPPPTKNRYLEIGAAMQNMILMAHALGLGACWSTFSERQIQEIHDHFALPTYVEVVTYLALGWPAEAVLAPGRMAASDLILNH